MKAQNELCFALKHNLGEFKTRLNLPPNFAEEAIKKFQEIEEEEIDLDLNLDVASLGNLHTDVSSDSL